MQSRIMFAAAGLALSLPAHAHVKWFSMMADCASAPLTTLNVLASPLFLALALASSAAMLAVAAADGRVSRADGRVARFAARLDCRAAALAAPILRIGVALYFLTIVLYFHGAPIILTVELKTNAAWVPALQLAIAAAALMRRTALAAACGIVVLFAYACASHGFFHMLDYPVFLGVAAFIAIDALKERRWHVHGLAVLRVATGMSLLWCGVEKWLYPDWSYELLLADLRILLATGLSPKLIVMGAGFVEFGLAFLLIFGRLASQISAAVLLSVMLSAIPLVGMVDLVGHLPILVVLVLLATTRNPIGAAGNARAKGRGECDPALTFMLSVPGLIAAYHLSHEIAYDALAKLEWTQGLVAAVLVALLAARIVHIAPAAFSRPG